MKSLMDLFRAGDEVLDGLVQGVAHVQGAVGEGRAVVQGEEGLALVLLQQFLVDVLLLPASEHLRLPLGQTCPHGEVGLRQIDGLVVIHIFPPIFKPVSECSLIPGENDPAVPAQKGPGACDQPQLSAKRHIAPLSGNGKAGHGLRPEDGGAAAQIAGLHGLLTVGAVHGRTHLPLEQNKNALSLFQETKRFENTLRYHSRCRPLTGSGPSMPAVTGRCCNGHRSSLPTRVVFQQEAPR